MTRVWKVLCHPWVAIRYEVLQGHSAEHDGWEETGKYTYLSQSAQVKKNAVLSSPESDKAGGQGGW